MIDGAGRYLGETLIRKFGGTWNSGDARAEGYMFQNQPVIAGVTPEAFTQTTHAQYLPRER